MAKTNVLVSIPVHRTIELPTMICLLETVKSSKHNISYYFRIGDGLISRSRNELGRMLLQQGKKYDYLMFIDDDILWNPKDRPIDRLIARNKDIICGIYTVRDDTLRPAIRTKQMQQLAEKGKYKNQKVVLPKKVFEIEYGTSGFMLIKRECLKAVYQFSSHPFTPALDKNKEYLSEDYAFCWRAKKLGYKVYADPTIKLGHIGQCVYSLAGIKSINTYENGFQTS